MDEEKTYSKEDLKQIWMHRVCLFVMIFLALITTAMKALLAYNMVYGILVSLFLSGMLAYFMSYPVYRWVKESGWWIYGIIFFVILLMLARY